MPSGTAFGIFALVAAVAAIAFFRWLARRSARTLDMPDEGPAIATWNGGLRTRTMSATGGTARLELSDWGIRVRGRGRGGGSCPRGRPVMENWSKHR
jgi:hypothetical protein